MEIGPASGVRVTLSLNQTCPNADVQAELDGTMTWQAFGSATAVDGVQFGDRLAATFSFNVGQPLSITSGNGSTPGADHGASQNQTGVALLSLGEVGGAQMPGGTFHPPGTNGDQGTVLDGGLTKNPFGSGQ